MTADTARRSVFLAEQIRGEAIRHSLDVVLTTKEYGTLEALEEVDSPSDIKLALVVGGVTARDYPHVRTVTVLTNEHLHLLVKRDLADKGLSGLRGKRIALGPRTTASYHIACDVLNFVGLLPSMEIKSGEYGIDRMTPLEALHELSRIEVLEEPERSESISRLPDAVMLLAPLPSPFIKRLITDFAYELVQLPFAEAYGLDRLNSSGSDGVRIDRSLITVGAIPSYTYGSDPAEPALDCPTICVPLILVAQDNTDPVAISHLLETIFDSALTNAIRPPPLDEQAIAFPRHQGTVRYLHRNDPFLTSEEAATLIKLAGAIGCLLSGTIAFYSFLRLRNLKRFEYYYREIWQIEMISRGFEKDSTAPTDAPSLQVYLERRLTTLKCQALQDFAAGGMKGEALMAGIIALINDTRESLARTVTVHNFTQESPAFDDSEPTSSISCATGNTKRK